MEIPLFDQKVKKNNIGMIIPVRVCCMGYLDDGHMTNYQKWTKTKIVALNCSFQNQLEFCCKVLLLWRYEVKDFQKWPVFFVLHFSQ
jgi:hypothetical protein